VKDALLVSQKGFHVPTFSDQVAADLAQLIEYAYSFTSGAVPGTYPPPFPPGLPTGYTIVALAQADDDFWGYTNAQYYGIVAVASGQVVIAIRGTDDISEWLIDFEFPLTPFLPISGAGLVEYGFLSVFSTLTFVDPDGKPFDLTAYLESALASNPKTEIIIEGHSLGGPIACMLALVTADGNTALKNATTVYTFASPAPGDDVFAASNWSRPLLSLSTMIFSRSIATTRSGPTSGCSIASLPCCPHAVRRLSLTPAPWKETVPPDYNPP
jgi:triacylglycerol lipase